MASDALVDSNVFISYLRRGKDPAAELLERFEDVYTCPMVRLEVQRGLKLPAARDRLAGFFDTTCNVTIDHRIWTQATELAWTLDRSGFTIPAPDIIIAACAVRARVPIFTADLHFDHVEDLEVIPFHDSH